MFSSILVDAGFFVRRAVAAGVGVVWAFLFRRRPRSASSCGNSFVLKDEQVCLTKCRSCRPRLPVHVLRRMMVGLVCRRSFARVCHSAKVPEKQIEDLLVVGRREETLKYRDGTL